MIDKCSYVIEKFLELDKNERIPMDITQHILTCSKCRSQIRMFSHAEHMVAKDSLDNPFSFVPTNEVMEKLYPGSTEPKHISIKQWLIFGIILLICMILCSIAIARFIPQLQIFGFLFTSGIIITYCLLFIGLNLDFFVKA